MRAQRTSGTSAKRPSVVRLVALATVLVAAGLAGCVKTKDATGTDATDEGTGAPAPGGDTTAPTVVELSVSSPQVPPYSFSPNALSAKAGETVNLTYTNDDAVAPHNWVFDEAQASTDTIGGGESASVTFVAPAAGTYEFYCAVGNHRTLGMVGTFTVT